MAAIRTLQHTESLDVVWDDLVYSEARFLKDKNATDLAPKVSALVARTEQVRVGQFAAWRAETVAQAGVDNCDDTMDDTVDAIDTAALAIVKQDASSPRYRRYFSDAPNLIIRMGLQAEMKRVGGWPESLQSEPEAELKMLGARLDGDLKQSDAALKERVQAAGARADHRVRDIVALIDDVNAARLSLFGILVQRAVERKLPRDWPNRFFRRTARAPKKAKTTT